MMNLFVSNKILVWKSSWFRSDTRIQLYVIFLRCVKYQGPQTATDLSTSLTVYQFPPGSNLKLPHWLGCRVARSLEIFSRTFCFSRDAADYCHGCSQRGENVFLPPPLEIGTKGQSTLRTSQQSPGAILCLIASGNFAPYTARRGNSWPQ